MVPHLRPDVQTFSDPRGLIVYDPHTGLRVLLGPESTLLWNALAGGARSISALKHSTPELSDAQRFVRLMQLDQALLLVSPRWRRQEHLFHTRAKSVDAPLYVHPRLAHECVRCGSSCQEIHVGPISSLTAASIRNHDLWRLDPKARKAEDILFQTQVQKQSVLMLKQVDGHCAVWTHDRGCAIHATSGNKLKPLACQQYPYTMTRTSKGVYVGLQMSCRSLPQSLTAGSNYRPTEIAQRLAPIVMSGGQTQTLPAPPPLSAGSYIPDSALEEWWRWSVQVIEQSLTEIELHPREFQKNTTWKEAIQKLNDYAHEWLLRVDESDETTQWLEADVWLFQSHLPTRHEVKLSFIDELQHSIQEASIAHQKEGRWQEMKRLERLYEAVEVWSERWTLPSPRWKGHTGDYLLNLVVLEAVHSHRLFLQGDLIYGLAHLRLYLELAESVMRLEAHLSARLSIEESEVNDALVMVYRAMQEPIIDAVLKRWAGGLRWLMSPAGMPYRHNLGTLEPHLFKPKSHIKSRSSSERLEREGEALAAEITRSREEAQREPPQALIESREGDSIPPADISDHLNVDLTQQQGDAPSVPPAPQEGMASFSAEFPVKEISSGNANLSPPDPYPSTDVELVQTEEETPNLSFEDDANQERAEESAKPALNEEETSSNRLRKPATPATSSKKTTPKGINSPYDQAAGLRVAAQRAKWALSEGETEAKGEKVPEDMTDPPHKG